MCPYIVHFFTLADEAQIDGEGFYKSLKKKLKDVVGDDSHKLLIENSF